MIENKYIPTILAVSGAIAIGLGVLIISYKTGNVDSELLKMLISNLMSFAGGGVAVKALSNASNKNNNTNDNVDE